MNSISKNTSFISTVLVSILTLYLLLLPHYLVAADVLPQSKVKQLIDETFSVMQKHYIEPDIVSSTKQLVVARFERGEYSSLTNIQAFADVIGTDIRTITGDVHLSLFTAKPTDKVTHTLTHKAGKLTYNYAFEQARYLDGNVGYLKFNKFHPDEKARDTLDAAFNFLKQSDAMIIDLRDTVGGSPALVQYMLSYFLAFNTPLWEEVGRDHQLLSSISVTDKPKHQRFHNGFPVWLLTSQHSASATELFVGVMQANVKATIIGETTAGAGFYVGVEPITPELIFRISMSKPVISVNQQNWEKIGITPDLIIPAIDALNYAKRAAFEVTQKD
jgi:C-terminal processing protease CtpA/Prc